MNNPKNKRPSGVAGMSRRATAKSIKRIEEELFYSSDGVFVRLGRIEEKLEHVATRDDLKDVATRDDLEKFKDTMHRDMEQFKVTVHGDVERLRTEMTAHSNTLFRWTIGIFVSVAGVIVTVLKLT